MLSVLVFLSYFVSLRRKIGVTQGVLLFNKLNISDSRSLLIFFVLFLVVFLSFKVNEYSFISMALRGGELVNRPSDFGRFESLVFDSFLRLIPMFLAVFLLFFVRDRFWLKVVVLFAAILCVFPTAIPRLRVPALYIPLLIFFFPRSLNDNKLVMYIAAGLVFLFPFLDNFRRFSFDKDLSFDFGFSYMVQGHFDAFQNFARFIHSGFTSWGEQLIGALMFFIPRSLWPGKPVGTGYQMAVDNGYYFTNISSTFYMEGWANFGPFGAVIFAILIGGMMARLDVKFWGGQGGNFYKISYFVGLGYLFFLLRGDLMSAFAYAMGILMSMLVAYYLIFFKIFKRSEKILVRI